MPALFNPLGFAQCKLIWTLTGDAEPMVCVFGVANDDDLTVQQIADFVDASWQDEVVPATLSSAWTYRGAEAQLGTAEGSGGDVAVNSSAVVGTASTAAMPQNVSMLVHKRSASSGRKNRGRMYLPGGYLQETAVDPAGAVSSGLITSFGALLTAFLADLATGNLPMVIFHSDSVATPTLVTSLTIDPVIGTQRTRLRR